jgi:hypothetical protein
MFIGDGFSKIRTLKAPRASSELRQPPKEKLIPKTENFF